MNTELIYASDANCVERAASLLAQGKVIAIPTETVYGLAADASNPAAIAEIYAVKQRPTGHPLIMHFAEIEDIAPWVKEFPEMAMHLAQTCWPGPLSMLLYRSDLVSDCITGGSEKVCVRIPSHNTTRQIIQHLGRPIVAPSANMFGAISPTVSQHVMEELNGRICAIVDGGMCQVGLESTILDMTTSPAVLLRPGGYSLPALETLLGYSIALAKNHQTKVSGNLENHYQPKTRLKSFSAKTADDMAAIPHGAVIIRYQVHINQMTLVKNSWQMYAMPEDAVRYGHLLYAVLRMFDSGHYPAIYIELPPQTTDWLAVHDRIAKAVHKD